MRAIEEAVLPHVKILEHAYVCSNFSRVQRSGSDRQGRGGRRGQVREGGGGACGKEESSQCLKFVV